MTDLPQNWIKCELGEVISLKNGYAFKSSDYTDSGIDLIRISDIKNNEISLDTTVKMPLAKINEKFYIENGDLLIAMSGATTGKIGVYNSDKHALQNQRVGNFKIKNRNNLIDLYRNYYLKYIKKDIEIAAYGGAQPNISGKQIEKFHIKLPPLNEQKRIVKKLDVIMPKVDEVNSRLDRIPQILKRARQSILNQAITGELTKDWRKNQDKETLALFSKQDIEDAKIRYYNQLCLKAIENNMPKPKFPKETKVSDKKIGELPDLPDGWNYYRLFDISNLVTDGTHKTPKYVDSGIPFLSVKNVRPFKIFDTDIKYITPEESKTINLRCNPEKGDILYTKVGATYGFATKINLDYEFSIFVSLALIKPVKQYFTSDYAEIVLNSDLIFNQAREKISGIAVPDLHLIEIKDFRIPLPSVEEQTEIVKRVKEAFEKLDKIEEQYKKAKSYTDKLTQSILHKAFNGDLVPQYPNDKPVEI